MITGKHTRRNLTLLTAFAVFWVFFNALLNFHTHRILGTELIDHAYPAIKPKTKENTVHFSELSQNSTYHLFNFSTKIDLSEPVLPSRVIEAGKLELSDEDKFKWCSVGLRAPPLF